MKPYNERLPLIDAAIDYCKGVVPKNFCNQNGSFYLGGGRIKQLVNREYLTVRIICTLDEFNQRKAERQNKPDWADAPEWANWLAQSSNGHWYWYGEKPNEDILCFLLNDGGVKQSVYGEVIGNWQDTLEYRPETNTGNYDNYHTALGGVNWGLVNKSMCIDIPKEQDMNDWYEKGEKPPAGIECEFKAISRTDKAESFASEWERCTVAFAGANGAVVIDALGDECFIDELDYKLSFRPLRTETDKLVDSVEKILNGCESVSNRAVAHALVNAGYRKIKPMSRDDFFNHVVDKFGIDSVTAFEMFKAGCRFLGKGE